MRILVTGGAGFIGHHTVAMLLQNGHEVLVLDNLSMGKHERVPAEALFLQRDILDREGVNGAFSEFKPEAVLHLAARVSIRASVDDFTEDAMQNFIGTSRVLEAAIRAGTRRFILASSMAVYADTSQPLPIDESYQISPPSPYGISKYAAEMLVHRMGQKHGLETMVLRFFNTFGTGQTLTPYVGVMTIFINRILQGRPPVIFGDGEQCRDFVYVGDIAKACTLALESRQNEITCNIGTGRGTTINQLAGMLLKEMDAIDLQPEYGQARAEETRNSVASIALARSVLGYEPTGVLEEKIGEVIEANRSLGAV